MKRIIKRADVTAKHSPLNQIDIGELKRAVHSSIQVSQEIPSLLREINDQGLVGELEKFYKHSKFSKLAAQKLKNVLIDLKALEKLLDSFETELQNEVDARYAEEERRTKESSEARRIARVKTKGYGSYLR